MEWILRSGNDSLFDLKDKELRNRRVCSLHFPDVAFTNEIKKSFNCKAIPNFYEIDSNKENNRNGGNPTSFAKALQNKNHQSHPANYSVHVYEEHPSVQNDVIMGYIKVI